MNPVSLIRTPSTVELLAAWERGLGQSSGQQALALLAAGCPDADGETLADLPIGRRDACLLALRAECFGSRVIGVTGCPACPEQLELDFDLADVQVTAGWDMPAEPLEVTAAGYTVRFRLPATTDLLSSTATGDLAGTRQALLTRCLVGASREGCAVAAEDLPDALPAQIVTAIEERMAQADPQADIRFAVNCPDCGHASEVGFDIAAFLWRELEAWALRTLSEVHLLAYAYGWSEAEILALSPARRRFYLEAVSR